MSETQTSAYPTSLDALLRIVDGVSRVQSEDLNQAQAAVQAIQETLGTGIAGSLSDLKTRLAVNIANNGTLKEFYWGTTTTENDTFSVPPSGSFTTAPSGWAMTMQNPTANGAVIWAFTSSVLGAAFQGAKSNGNRTNLDSVTVGWIVWNPNP